MSFVTKIKSKIDWNDFGLPDLRGEAEMRWVNTVFKDEEYLIIIKVLTKQGVTFRSRFLCLSIRSLIITEGFNNITDPWCSSLM